MDPIEGCQRTLDGTTAMVRALGPADLDRPTPCTKWDVRALVEHMTGVCASFAAACRGEAAPSATGGAAAPGAGPDPVAAYIAAADDLMQQWREPGALDKELTLAFGQMPGSRAIRIAIADQLIHTWDLGQAVGRPVDLDPELSEAVLAMMQQLIKPEYRGENGAFGEEVQLPAGAPVQERMLAFSGRRP